MILDTSALLAILLREPEAERFAEAIEAADVIRMSVASYLEAAIFVDRHGDAIRRAMLDTFLEEFSIRLEPVTVEQIRIARQSFQSFGKGMHPAGLDFGDCFTYALARVTREAVLFKGQDFTETDLISAIQ
ncbi:MAG: type II toxin-antitoxin system VapC family toxin [Acidobacteriales bacterium]|nr:type II toxin-antitoxin system VapC family toxin [Terriglobales bacterium]